jgi:hypothetical protein
MRLITETKSLFTPLHFGAIILALLVLASRPALGAIQDVVGEYGGSWSNITYASTGAAVINISVTGTNAALTFDMDGGVFGGSDPAKITMPGYVQGNVIQIDNKGVGIYGDIKGAVDSAAGTLAVTLTNVPGGYIQYVTVTGFVTNGVISLTYIVNFQPVTGYPPAHGIMKAVRVAALSFTSISIQGTNVVLKWTGGIAPYTVETRGDLRQGAWTNVGVPNGTNILTNIFAVPYSRSNTLFRASGR